MIVARGGQTVEHISDEKIIINPFLGAQKTCEPSKEEVR
jgi:hypothetical protein